MIKASVIGASGYTGGELYRLLLMHPQVQVQEITSERFAGEFATKIHPNLRSFSQQKFSSVKDMKRDSDVVFLCTPHEKAMDYVAEFMNSGMKIIDLSADFRLRNAQTYERYYTKHRHPELLSQAVLGIPELHHEEIRNAKLVGAAGCLSTSVILALAPLVKNGLIDTERIIADAKIGSAAAGASFDISTHHPERQGVVRSYKPTGHRHTAEIEQEMSLLAGRQVRVGLTPHAVEMVRGIMSTVHCWLPKQLADIDMWKAYRGFYRDSPFVRLVKEKGTLYRYPEPKMVVGTNFCDIGFELDPTMPRVVVMSAIDNLVKGSGGQAIQCMNLMFGLDEKEGLWRPGMHPI
jgi:N-acetyl-gamma-glutamyl-phosphate/LysW-gamma-L-alpha-aminoadipyl-6-phosphate reductase